MIISSDLFDWVLYSSRVILQMQQSHKSWIGLKQGYLCVQRKLLLICVVVTIDHQDQVILRLKGSYKVFWAIPNNESFLSEVICQRRHSTVNSIGLSEGMLKIKYIIISSISCNNICRIHHNSTLNKIGWLNYIYALSLRARNLIRRWDYATTGNRVH